MKIGQLFVAAGTLLQMFFPQYQEEATFLIQVGTDLVAGKGTVGPVRLGNESLTATVGPWKQ